MQSWIFGQKENKFGTVCIALKVKALWKNYNASKHLSKKFISIQGLNLSMGKKTWGDYGT